MAISVAKTPQKLGQAGEKACDMATREGRCNVATMQQRYTPAPNQKPMAPSPTRASTARKTAMACGAHKALTRLGRPLKGCCFVVLSPSADTRSRAQAPCNCEHTWTSAGQTVEAWTSLQEIETWLENAERRFRAATSQQCYTPAPNQKPMAPSPTCSMCFYGPKVHECLPCIQSIDAARLRGIDKASTSLQDIGTRLEKWRGSL